ncbi:dihydrodipicolinate synthase family protein [Rhodobacteraceae bacterium NNCM2]|nr:dihydrodipicolinate synthase family protein [Coraliihabitans acroporae]
MTKARKGVYAATITPVAPDGTPDIAKLVTYSRRLIADGLDGVAPAGTTGEGNSLPMRSRLAMPAAFAEAGLAGDQVIFGTGSCAADDAVELTKACVAAGFPNVLVLPPFYLKNVPEDGLFAYYARLIEGVGSDTLRVYLYHFPQMSMTPIPVSLVPRLKAEFGPVIAGLKDSSGAFEGSLAFAAAAEGFDVFPSNEGVLLEALAKGCGGIISATTNASAGLARLTLSASGEAAQQAQERLHSVRKIISNYPLSAALKQIEAWRSGDDSWRAVFPPLVPLPAGQAQELRRELEELGLDAIGLADAAVA